MQQIMIIGRLAADAAVKSATRNGTKSEFVAFKVLVNEKSGDETITTGYDVTMAKTGVFEHLKKGTLVFVNGKFRHVLTEKDGKTYANLNVGALTVELLGGKKQEGEGAEA